jgi:CheY-like chemotaxis protein
MPSILVVDDDSGSCRLLLRLLGHLGHLAESAESGEQALAYLQNHVPELVILDVMMPGMDGLELLRRMRAAPRTARVPVVMFSAVSDPQLIEHALSKGANGYWVKGHIDFNRLDELVRPYLVCEEAPERAARAGAEKAELGPR